jgi:hypothetical protein
MEDASDNKSILGPGGNRSLLGPGGTQDVPSSDSTSGSSAWANWGYTSIAILVLIALIIIIPSVLKSVYPESLIYIGFIFKNFVGNSMYSFLNFLPTIFLVLGPLMDAINYEFQATKISIAGLLVLFLQPILGGLLKIFQKIIGAGSDDGSPISGLVSNFIDSCRVNAMGISFNSTGIGGVSNYGMILFFISACYMISLGLINKYNPGASFPQWYVGPSVMFGISLFGSLARLFNTNNCDNFLNFAYGISYSAIWSSIYFAIGYFSNKRILPYNNKIWGLGTSSDQDNQTGPNAKPNTNQSCASPQGDGVIYEIYQDGQMVGTV